MSGVHTRTTSTLFKGLALLILIICVVIGVVAIQQQQKSQTHAAVTTTFQYASVDTMKESMDTDTNQLTPAQIADDVNLAATLNVTHITVNTFWDYPSYTQEWVDAIRAKGKHVWFRMHPNAWEGNNGVAATMTPSQYLVAEKAYLLAHPSFFQSGDILDMNPEPENSPYWINTYGANWGSVKAATDEYNSFYIGVTDTANQALAQLGITGVITTIRSTNSWFSQNPTALYPATVAYMGRVSFDSYPDQTTTDPATAVSNRLAELQNIETIRNVPIVIAEFGYNNQTNVDDMTQHTVISAELSAMESLPYIQGLNYWVGAGGAGYGGYTNIFTGSRGNWKLRPAAQDLANYFFAELIPTLTPTHIPTNTKLALTIGLDGIGKAGDNVSRTSTGNISPLHPTRTVTVNLSDQNNTPLSAVTGTVTYDTTSELFKGTVSLPSSLTTGFYTLKVSSPSFLQKSISAIVSITSGQTTIIPTTYLTAGDINNDNQVSLLDYNMLLGCFSSTASSCSPADLDDDGAVGGADYNLFLRELSVQNGG